MSDRETLDERLRAVERALTDRDEPPDRSDEAELRRTVTDVAARVDDLETRLNELDSAVQALRGYVGNIRAVNAEVERRADAALAKAETNRRDVRTPESVLRRAQSETEPKTDRRAGSDRGQPAPDAPDDSNDSFVARIREVL